MKELENKKILVTGACGTIGRELIRELVENTELNPSEIIGIDNNETDLFFLDQQYRKFPHVDFYFADIRGQESLNDLFNGVSIIFHLAALKHVAISERRPEEAIKTNIEGIRNIIAAAKLNNVEKVVFTSSDKAVNPTNVMGTSKLMGERLITAANSNAQSGSPIFYTTRFGNVLGSNGSVIPIFQKQIAQGGPVTLTDTEMTRFVMSVEESVQLILNTLPLAHGGEVFISKMPVIRIEDLARVMINELAAQHGYDHKTIGIEMIGLNPGEKLYEELMNLEEIRRTYELDKYFVILPAFRGLYSDIHYEFKDVVSESVSEPYISSSDDALDLNELAAFLKKHCLIDEEQVVN